MFEKILSILEHHIFGMGLVFVLWIILIDQNAIKRINKPIIKKITYFSIIVYYLLIIIEVIQNIYKQ